MQDEAEILQQVDDVSEMLQLPTYVVEKDLYVTKVISIGAALVRSL